VFDTLREHLDFEAGAENMELYSLRREAEEMARREAAMDDEMNPYGFREALAQGRESLTKGDKVFAQGCASHALRFSATPGQRRLAEALMSAATR
jgi:hypothetical protein